jgi:hypothetical protein
MKESKKIKLCHPFLGVREFDNQHAANIMSIPSEKRGGWEYLKTDDKVKSKVNAANDSGNTGNTGKQADTKPARNPKGGKSRK